MAARDAMLNLKASQTRVGEVLTNCGILRNSRLTHKQVYYTQRLLSHLWVRWKYLSAIQLCPACAIHHCATFNYPPLVSGDGDRKSLTFHPPKSGDVKLTQWLTWRL
jgi:hypothetical protein